MQICRLIFIKFVIFPRIPIFKLQSTSVYDACFFKVYRDDYKSYFKTSDCSMDNVDDSISYCFRYGHLPIIFVAGIVAGWDY